MKKFFICFIAVVFLSAGLFAATVKPAETRPASKLDVVTVTKELSNSEYPSELEMGSISGTSIFVTDFASMPNMALFEYESPGVLGATERMSLMFIMSTDMGKLGVSVNKLPIAVVPGVPISDPNTTDALRDIFLMPPSNVLGLHYAGKQFGTQIGASLYYGTDKTSISQVNVAADNPDYINSDVQYLGAKVGAVISGLDLSLGLALADNITSIEDFYDATDWDYKIVFDSSIFVADLNARAKLFEEITAFASLYWANGSSKVIDTYNSFPSGDNVDETYNSTLYLRAGAGRDFRLADTLKMKVSLGLLAGGMKDAKEKSYEFAYPDDIEYGTYPQNSDSVLDFPLNIAIEGKINDTWAFNGGIKVMILSLLGTKNAANTAENHELIREFGGTDEFMIQPAVEGAVGLSGTIGDFKLDLYLNPSIFMDGLFIFNNASTATLNSGVAAYYTW